MISFTIDISETGDDCVVVTFRDMLGTPTSREADVAERVRKRIALPKVMTKYMKDEPTTKP